MWPLLLGCAQVNPLLAEPGGTDDSGVSAGEEAPVEGELLINEVMFDPDAVDGDFGEWVELRSLADRELDLLGVGLVDDGGTGIVVGTSVRVPPSGFVVLGVSADPAENGGVEVDYAYSIEDLKFGNEGDAVGVLVGETWLDLVVYDGGVEFPYAEGWSIQLDPSVDSPDGNDEGSAWCLPTRSYGAGDHGSPGEANESCGTAAR